MRYLETRLRDAVALLMASPVVLASCGADVPPGIENDPGFIKPSCQDPNGDMLRGLTPEPAVDYLELRSTVPMGTPPTAAVARLGSLCAGAVDNAACTALFNQATNAKSFPLSSCVDGCDFYYMVTTRGDAVTVLDTPGAVRTLLGAIDTPQEAVLLVRMRGLAVPCDRGGAKPSSGGFDVQSFDFEGCDGVTRHIFHVGADGTVVETALVVEHDANPNCAVGRRPAGLSKPRFSTATCPLARYLSRAAHLEAASVHAFRGLAHELSLHGAPRRLVAAAYRAANDEVRHAGITFDMARRFGAKRFEAPRIEPAQPRDLEAIATENAVEGCVRETFGAAVGIWQGRRARDGAVAHAMRGIARDETRHASLAWEIARWSDKRLGVNLRRRIRGARIEAVASLRNELRSRLHPSVVDVLGVPSSEDALRLHAELRRLLWSSG